jgi:hypothetical protein
MKYVSHQVGSKQEEYLFDLKADVGEKQNLLTTRPQEAVRLRRLLAAWEEEVKPKR